ncbi:MAG: NAD(P)H-binding protein [Proteobacteria bacterium]|nr:NAD(P)H-binding protein [Pseudomonadota bacterium]
MSLILVTGGTGHLGRDIVPRLLKAGHRVRIFARAPRPEIQVEWAVGDLATGKGLRAALQGVHTVINAATDSPIARRGGVRPLDFVRSPSAVDVEGTGRLIDLCHEASVQHFLHVSIVGLEEAMLPYAKIKLAGEKLVRNSPLPWSVVRATPFYYLLEKTFAGVAPLPVWPLPRTPFNPVDTADVADYLVRCAFDGARGERAEIGGPDDLSCIEFARQYQKARHLRRAIVPLSEHLGRRMGFIGGNGVRGTLSWAEWLDRGAAAAVAA